MAGDPTTVKMTVELVIGYDAACSILSKCKAGTEIEVVSDVADFRVPGKAIFTEITTYPLGICPNCHTDYRGTGLTDCTNCGETVPQP